MAFDSSNELGDRGLSSRRPGLAGLALKRMLTASAWWLAAFPAFAQYRAAGFTGGGNIAYWYLGMVFVLVIFAMIVDATVHPDRRDRDNRR